MSIAKSVQFPALLQFSFSPTLIFIVNENIIYFLQDKLIYVAQVISLPFFFTGEAKNRKYNPSSFHRFNLYGVPTPHFNDGRTIAKTLYWLHELQM